jgi:hypothetical protein
MDPLALIESHAAELRALGAQRIGVFGSFARRETTEESDVGVYPELSAKKLLINPPSPPFFQGGISVTPPLPKGAAQRAGGF